MTESNQAGPDVGVVRGFSGFAVPDIEAAKTFYGETLGLEVSAGESGLLRLALPGGGEVVVYPKPDHVPAGFTILNLAVADIEAAVTVLTGRGVSFLRYDGFPQDERGIVQEGTPRIAWFTDPAGNILSVLQTD